MEKYQKIPKEQIQIKTNKNNNINIFYGDYYWIKRQLNKFVCYTCFMNNKSITFGIIYNKDDGYYYFRNDYFHTEQCNNLIKKIKIVKLFINDFKNEVKNFKIIIKSFKDQIQQGKIDSSKLDLVHKLENAIKENEDIIFFKSKKKTINNYYLMIIPILKLLNNLNN